MDAINLEEQYQHALKLTRSDAYRCPDSIRNGIADCLIAQHLELETKDKVLGGLYKVLSLVEDYIALRKRSAIEHHEESPALMYTEQTLGTIISILREHRAAPAINAPSDSERIHVRSIPVPMTIVLNGVAHRYIGEGHTTAVPVADNNRRPV